MTGTPLDSYTFWHFIFSQAPTVTHCERPGARICRHSHLFFVGGWYSMNNRRLWFAQRSGHALDWIARRPHFRSPRADSNAGVANISCCCLAVQICAAELPPPRRQRHRPLVMHHSAFRFSMFHVRLVCSPRSLALHWRMTM